MNIKDFKFEFETDNEYHAARSKGYIPNYEMVRMHVTYPSGNDVDYPVHSREELTNELIRLDCISGCTIMIYPSTHNYDVMDYA